MKFFSSLALSSLLVLTGLAAAFAQAQKPIQCTACRMNVDTQHRIHYRYKVDGKVAAEIGALTCAKRFWQKNKEKKLTFLAQDFVTGDWLDANQGLFLVHSKLQVGTGMDKGGAAIFFRDREMAEKARKANGGQIVGLERALSEVAQ